MNARNLSETAETPQRTQTRTQTHASSYAHTRQRNRATASMRPGVQVFDKRGEALAALAISPTTAAKKCVAVLVAVALVLGMVPLPHVSASVALADETAAPEAETYVAAQPETPFTPAAATGKGITLPGNYKQRGVTIDGVAFHVLYLDESDERALLLAKDVQYDALFDERGSNSWEKSTAREWLNSEWLAGKTELSSNVIETTITTRKNYFEETPTFIPTKDKVFLLSEPDVYGEEKTRFRVPLQPEDFTVVGADGKGVRLIAEDGPRAASKEGQARQWWMRSPAFGTSDVSYVCKIGRDLISRADVVDSERGFRPALWVKLAEISKETNPGMIDVTPHTSFVGPGNIVHLDAVVQDANGRKMGDEYQAVTWTVTGVSDLGMHETLHVPIVSNTKINASGRLEIDEREKDGTVLTITATSQHNPKIVGEAQVTINVTDWPVHTIQKTGSDTENLVILYLADGFQTQEQNTFLANVRRTWAAMLQVEPYRHLANRFNVYAMCTDSIESGINGEQSFFGSTLGGYGNRVLSIPDRTNHMMDRMIGPAFAKNYLDAGATEANIASYVVLSNSEGYGGSAYYSSMANFKYLTLTCHRQNDRIARHEMGHMLLGLGDEYESNRVKTNESPNMSVSDQPQDVMWREMLGYNLTGIAYHQNNVIPSQLECLMETGVESSEGLCDVCMLWGVRSLACQMHDESYYVFPAQLRWGNEYTYDKLQRKEYRDFSRDYGTYDNYRLNHGITNYTLTRSDINTIKGQKLELRTLVQNFSTTTPMKMRLDFKIQHADGSSTGIAGSSEITVDTWDDRENYNRTHHESDSGYDFKQGFPSGLQNCVVSVDVPAKADLREGDKVVFSLVRTDDDGKEQVLLSQNSKDAKYVNVTIHYRDTEGKELDEAQPAKVPMQVGETFTWEAPQKLGKYKYVGAAGDTKGSVTVDENGAEVFYTYAIDDTPKSEPTPSQTDISGAEVSGLHAVTYNGNEQKLSPSVRLGSNTLSPETDYTVTYSDDMTNAGTVRVTITGKDNYKGTISKSYEIQPAPIDVPQGYTNLVYTGFAQTGVPSGHYTLTGETTGTNASTIYTAYATPISNYRWNTGNPTDRRIIRWSIAQKPLTGATIALEYQSTDVTGAAIKPNVTSVRVGDLNVPADNYDVSYSNNTEPGTGATVILRGKKNFSGTESTTFTINGTLSTDNATVEPLADVNYGDQMISFINPVVKLKQGTTPLTKGVDFTVEFEGMPTTDPGAGKSVRVTAIIKGNGKYKDDTVANNKLLKVNFTVIGQAAPAPTVDTHTYTGKPIRPGVNLSDANGTLLKEGRDYIIAYSNNVRPGTARMTIVGIGLYCGTIERTFKIVRPARNATPSTIQSVASESITEAASARSTIDTVALATAAQMTFRPDTLYKIG